MQHIQMSKTLIKLLFSFLLGSVWDVYCLKGLCPICQYRLIDVSQFGGILWFPVVSRVLLENSHPSSNTRRFPISWYTKPNCGYLRPAIVELD